MTENAEAALPELPVLSDAEWRALPAAEKDRLRGLKKLHRLRASGQAVPMPAGPQEISGTPFRAHDGSPIRLNIGQGGQCFLILCGPSLVTLDLHLLGRRGVYTIGVNNSPALWRPNGWIFVDPPQKFHESIWLDPAVMKFVNNRFMNDKRILRHRKSDGTFEPLKIYKDGKPEIVTVANAPGVVGIVRNAFFQPDKWLSEPSINWGSSQKSSGINKMPRVLNSMLAAVKAAYALGFRTVYLCGCDFNMQPGRVYAFAEEKDAGECASNQNSYRTLCDLFGILKPHFDAAGFRVFNTNPDSGLKVFPHVSFRDAIAAATDHIPQELQTLGWYEKN